jgi:hypothetical protein
VFNREAFKELMNTFFNLIIFRKNNCSLILLSFFIIYIVNAQERPKLDSSISWVNDSLNYSVIGYEEKNNRFWVVMDSIITESQDKLNKIIITIYKKSNKNRGLDSLPWCISFFSNKDAIGYKTFESNEYLGEYWSVNTRNIEKRNRIYVYPIIPSRVKWYKGPNIFRE